MTPGDRAALEALSDRLRHVAATAQLAAKAVEQLPPYGDVLDGVAATLEELRDRLDTLTGQPAA